VFASWPRREYLIAVLERGGILKLILIYRLRIDLGSIAKNLPNQKGIKRCGGQPLEEWIEVPVAVRAVVDENLVEEKL
jgi:hypothetical protein